MKDGFLDKLITRLDRFSPSEVQNLVARLVREKGFMESVFESLREGVLILAPEGTITFANNACHKLLGLDVTKSVGQKVTHVIRGLEWETIAKPERVVVRDMEVFYPENRFLNFYLSPINSQVEEKEGKEEHLGYVMLIHDVTDSKKEREATIENEQLNALTFLAAGVAHEIGNPLNSLDIHLQLMKRKIGKLNELKEDSKDSLEKLLATAQQEIRRLDNILKQFLHAIRPQTLHRKKAQLHLILKTTLETLAAELEERNIKISLDLAETLPLLDLDQDQIQQALYNILRNAAQAVSSDGGQISISTQSNDHEIITKIEDNGSGFSPEQMGALFEPFKTSKQSGSGLGLLIVRRIIREHGGEIEIESEKDKGTIVKLYLPRFEKNVRLLQQHFSEKPHIDIE